MQQGVSTRFGLQLFNVCSGLSLGAVFVDVYVGLCIDEYALVFAEYLQEWLELGPDKAWRTAHSGKMMVVDKLCACALVHTCASR